MDFDFSRLFAYLRASANRTEFLHFVTGQVTSAEEYAFGRKHTVVKNIFSRHRNTLDARYFASLSITGVDFVSAESTCKPFPELAMTAGGSHLGYGLQISIEPLLAEGTSTFPVEDCSNSSSSQMIKSRVMDWNNAVEFLLGGLATSSAGFFTNPLEVVKTRMQLQGELQARGQYSVHYRSAAHAFYTIARNDGVTALQSGLVPALCYQFFMNGVRLGIYQVLINMGFTTNDKGELSIPRSILAGAAAGCLGASFASPFYMVKTHLQAQAVKEIAVGHQHPHCSMSDGFRSIYSNYGMQGLWRGVSGAAPRVTVGSAAQLSSFSAAKDFVIRCKIFKEDSWLNALVASMISGVAVTLFMTPFDVVSTRLYNQGLDARGRGLLYKGVFDCFLKIFQTEGLWGFYKGWGASYFRLGPHTILSLVFWDEFRKLYLKTHMM